MADLSLTEILTSRFTLAILVSFVSALVLTPVVLRLAVLANAVDQPNRERSVHTKPTPRWGGLAIYLAVVIGWLVVYPLSHHPADVPMIGPYTVKSVWILGLGGLVVLFGMLDDLYAFSATWQALFLLIVGAVLAHPDLANVRIEGIGIPFGEYINFSETNSVLLTILYVFLISKTMDTMDGLDGLSAGIAVIMASTMLVLALWQQPLIGVLSATVIGACLGFLRYNWHPAKIFMGTGGAQFLGFFLAAISIQGVVKTAAAVAFLVPVLLFGVPLFDALLVVFRRAASRAPITQADKRHLHHTLLGKGLNQRQAVTVIYAITFLLCLTAVIVIKVVT
ncbi:MAG: undecaprenyl-phosphate alpha-N-acetylglucosaminyl 1-phosphate transferase [Fimbriimonadales bacterium]|nr:MAG: undecaprenyl-phosphate alpha-N-acetylglucosaminyl 1-phosphate transferase [Fimbriimonadales bacterium]